VSKVFPWEFFLREEWKLWFLLLGLWDILFYDFRSPKSHIFYCGDLSSSLANRCELSSHSSPSWVTMLNIIMLSFHEKTLSQISIMLFVLGSYACSVLSRLGSLETLSLSLSLLFCILVSWRSSVSEKQIDSSDFHITIYVFRRGFVALILSTVVYFFIIFASWVFISDWVSSDPLLVTMLPFEILLCRDLRWGSDSLALLFSEILRGRTGVSWERIYVCINLSCFVNYFIFISANLSRHRTRRDVRFFTECSHFRDWWSVTNVNFLQ